MNSLWERIEREMARRGKAEQWQQWLADALGYKVQRVNNWRSRGVPAREHQAIAEALGRSLDWVAGLEPDTGPNMSAPKSNVVPLLQTGAVPLLSWVRAGQWCEAQESPLPDADEWLPCPVKHGPKTYALRVMGDSMDGPGGSPSSRSRLALTGATPDSPLRRAFLRLARAHAAERA